MWAGPGYVIPCVVRTGLAVMNGVSRPLITTSYNNCYHGPPLLRFASEFFFLSTKKVKDLFTKCKTALNCKTYSYNFKGKEHWQRGKWEENWLQKSLSNALTGQMCAGIQVKFIRFFPFLVTGCLGAPALSDERRNFLAVERPQIAEAVTNTELRENWQARL